MPQDAGTDGTELFAAVNAGLADVPPDRVGAVIMLTDGEVHDTPQTAADLGGAPLHALITGRPDETRPPRRHRCRAAFRHRRRGPDRSPIASSTTARGDRGTVAVSIYRDGELVQQQLATIGEEQTYQFTVPHAGNMVYEFVAEPLDGELTDLNNRAVVTLDGVRQNLRVLLVSGRAACRRAHLARPSEVRPRRRPHPFHHPAPRRRSSTPRRPNELALIAFPTQELFVQKLNDFDLVIFDRYQHQDPLPRAYFTNIARLCQQWRRACSSPPARTIAGPTSIYKTGLSRVLPANPTGRVVEVPYLPTITDLGQRHPVTRDLPGGQADPPTWSHWYSQAEVVNPTGEVVMDGANGMPLLVLGHEGEGRVAMLDVGSGLAVGARL